MSKEKIAEVNKLFSRFKKNELAILNIFKIGIDRKLSREEREMIKQLDFEGKTLWKERDKLMKELKDNGYIFI